MYNILPFVQNRITYIIGGVHLLNQNQQENMQPASNMAPQNQFGGHELFSIKETVGGVVGLLEHYVLYGEYVQSEELKNIMHRQSGFLTQIYNTLLETLKSGQDPATKTQSYLMQENNQTTYGMQPTAPKSPFKSVTELNDECISAAILGQLKGIATHFTTSALEATNPVMRRIFADSIPNVIEMAFETYLYQNENGYYQVAQLKPEDTQAIINGFAPTQNHMTQ